jgi:hypothetical protein
MIHRRKIRESVSIGELFQNNRVGEDEDTLFNVEYDLKIRTPYGYHKVPTLVRTIKQTAIRLYFTNNKTLECGWDHKLKVNGEWKQVKDINIETDYVETDNGLTKVKRIYEGKEKILYDLSVDKVHCFYGNGILSHNTWALCALGAAAVKAGKTVVHYSMELSEKYVGSRYDTVFTQISSTDLVDKKDEVRDKIRRLRGKLLIKYFPPRGVSVKKLEAHIEKMTANGHKPDLIIVDYADLLLSHSSKSDSTYAEQGGVYIELRGMSGELGIPIWTASQTNRCHFVEDLVDTAHGKIQIGKIKKGDEILTHLGYKKVTHVFEKETQPVYKVKLKSGKEINISVEHLVPTQYGKLKSIRTGLKVGDKLFTKK